MLSISSVTNVSSNFSDEGLKFNPRRKSIIKVLNAFVFGLQFLEDRFPNVGVLAAILAHVHAGKIKTKDPDLQDKSIQQIEEQSLVISDQYLTGFE